MYKNLIMCGFASAVSGSVLTWILTENHWVNKVHFGKVPKYHELNTKE